MKNTETNHRRSFLRGAGLALPLPWLPSLTWRAGAAEPAELPPLRSAFLHFPNGAWMPDWTPASGEALVLSPTLQPLQPFIRQVTVFSGLDKPHSRTLDGHAHKTANFLTGMPVSSTTGRDFSAGGESVDQRIARHLQGQTPLHSLVLGVEPVAGGIDPANGVTLLYGSCISWQSQNRPVLPQVSPESVFDRLFGRSRHTQPSVASRRLLNFVLEDSKAISRRLGRDDQVKLEEYLESVDSMESRVRFLTRHPQHPMQKMAQSESLQRPVMPDNFPRHLEVMLDLLVLAFRCDAVRVASVMLANDTSQQIFQMPEGWTEPHHTVSHHQTDPGKIRQYQFINQWYVQQFAALLGRLQAIQEGPGTLLDNCQLILGSGMSDGNGHVPDDLPIVLAAGRSTGFTGGRHLHYPDQTVPLCNLYLSMLQKLGVGVDSFGDSDRALF
ncbi:MAG: DUF1552 domain-containing protein [Planctomycetaceae bacterium]